MKPHNVRRHTTLVGTAVAALLTALTLAACTTPAATRPAPTVQLSTRELEQHGPTILQTYKGRFLIGTAGDVPGGFEPDELALIKENFNAVTPENYLKPGAVHPLENTWNFQRPDALVQWCSENNIVVHGHTLVWHAQTNPWFFEGGDKATVSKRLENHIKTLVGRYKGRIHSWDVVNEAINDRGTPETAKTENLRRSNWYTILGPEFLTLAFKWAHEADPDAVLYYNDYNIEAGAKHQSSLVLLKRLLSEGAPVHGVGIQGHWSTNNLPVAELDKAIANYAALGLKVTISELDVTIRGVAGGQLDALRPAAAASASRPATLTLASLTEESSDPALQLNLADSMLALLPDLDAQQQDRLRTASVEIAGQLTAWRNARDNALLILKPQYGATQVAYQFEFEQYAAEVARQNKTRDELLNIAETKLLTFLTTTQAERWQIARLTARLPAGLDWSAAQTAQVTAAIADAAKKIANGPRDPAAIANAKAQLRHDLFGLLDDSQIARFAALNTADKSAAASRRGGGNPTPEGLKLQADAYARLFAIFEKHKNTIERVTFWGLNDRRSWRENQSPLVFDAENRRKPAYNAIVDVLLNRN